MELRRSARGGGIESEDWGCESGTRSVEGGEPAPGCEYPGAEFSLLLLSSAVLLASLSCDES